MRGFSFSYFVSPGDPYGWPSNPIQSVHLIYSTTVICWLRFELIGKHLLKPMDFRIFIADCGLLKRNFWIFKWTRCALGTPATFQCYSLATCFWWQIKWWPASWLLSSELATLDPVNLLVYFIARYVTNQMMTRVMNVKAAFSYRRVCNNTAFIHRQICCYFGRELTSVMTYPYPSSDCILVQLLKSTIQRPAKAKIGRINIKLKPWSLSHWYRL